MAALWTNLPSEVLGYILDKIDERDLETFLAASAVCRDWRCSSSLVSSISFVTCPLHCKKHHDSFYKCPCFANCIRSVLARSKSVSKLRIDLGWYGLCSGIDWSIALGKCNWLGTLQELHMGFGCTVKILQVVRSCSNLSVLSFDLVNWIEIGDVPQDLILPSLKSLSITGYIPNEVIQLLMEQVASLEYLRLRCDELHETFVINAPASVVRMELYFSKAENVLVNAAGVKDMIIQAIQVELEAPLLEELTLHFGTQIIKSSPAVRRLYMRLTGDSSKYKYIVNTLHSCLALSGIKTLCISPGLAGCSYNKDTYTENSQAFFEVMSKLTELEELELNFNMVMQLSPEGHEMTVFLPKLKMLALDCSVCALDYNGYHAERKYYLLEKFRSAWEYLKSMIPRARVVIRNEHRSSLTKKVDLLQRTSTCTE